MWKYLLSGRQGKWCHVVSRKNGIWRSGINPKRVALGLRQELELTWFLIWLLNHYTKLVLGIERVSIQKNKHWNMEIKHLEKGYWDHFLLLPSFSFFLLLFFYYFGCQERYKILVLAVLAAFISRYNFCNNILCIANLLGLSQLHQSPFCQSISGWPRMA